MSRVYALMLRIFGIFVETGFMIYESYLYVVAMFAWFLFLPFVVIFASLSFLCLMEGGKVENLLKMGNDIYLKIRCGGNLFVVANSEFSFLNHKETTVWVIISSLNMDIL